MKTFPRGSNPASTAVVATTQPTGSWATGLQFPDGTPFTYETLEAYLKSLTPDQAAKLWSNFDKWNAVGVNFIKPKPAERDPL